jgi:hypothetical protein
MPITFPRDFPSGKAGRFFDVSLDLTIVQSGQRTVGGSAAPVEYAEPFWVGRWRTTPLLRDDIDIWEAWLASLHGSQRLFWGTDPEKAFPRAYMATGWTGLVRAGTANAFNGQSNLSMIANSSAGLRDLITIGSGGQVLPAGFELRAGDLLNADRGNGKRSLHRVINPENAGGLASASAAGAWVGMIEPPLPIDVVTGSTIYLERPAAKMRKIKHEIPKSAGNRVRPATVSLEAIEDLTA